MNLRLPPIPPWEPKWGQAALLHEANTNPRNFARGFRMQAYNEDELMFRSLKSCYSPGANLAEWRLRQMPIFVGVDLAGDKRPGNAIVVLGLEPATQKRYLMEPIYGAWTAPQTVAQLAAVAARYPNLRYIMVENNGYQQSLIDFIQEGQVDSLGWWFKVESFTTGRNKADVRYGLPSLEVEFHNRAWVIPSNEFEGHQAGCQCPWCVWVLQVSQYPRGGSTDFVMATWFAREAIHKWGAVGGGGVGIGAGFNDR